MEKFMICAVLIVSIAHCFFIDQKSDLYVRKSNRTNVDQSSDEDDTIEPRDDTDNSSSAENEKMIKWPENAPREAQKQLIMKTMCSRLRNSSDAESDTSAKQLEQCRNNQEVSLKKRT